MAAPPNLKTAQLIISSPNTTIFKNTNRIGSFGPAPSYYTDTQQYYYPVVQSFTDTKEYYFCVKASTPNVNQVIKPSQIVVERNSSGAISNITYDENGNTDTKLYVMYKSVKEFENSVQPNKEYIITQCRAINLEVLTSNGRLSTFYVTQADGSQKEELIYLCYRDEESFFNEIITCGVQFIITIPTAFLAMFLKSRRKIFSNNVDESSRININ